MVVQVLFGKDEGSDDNVTQAQAALAASRCTTEIEPPPAKQPEPPAPPPATPGAAVQALITASSGMGRSRIDSSLARSQRSRVPDAVQILFGGTAQGLDTKIAKTTPCKVEWAPARSTHAACVRSTRWSVITAQPNLILL
ncbi:hypothetical protein V1278_005789 [Bradyrhizobium sp. AZCC 1577]